jgi:hypothetical protein
MVIGEIWRRSNLITHINETYRVGSGTCLKTFNGDKMHKIRQVDAKISCHWAFDLGKDDTKWYFTVEASTVCKSINISRLGLKSAAAGLTWKVP